MRVIRHLVRRPERLPGSVLTLGNFDGAHLGHQAIVRRAVARAREAAGLAVALTFEPHPVAVLAPAHARRSCSRRCTTAWRAWPGWAST